MYLLLTDAVRVRELVLVLRALEEAGAQPLVFKGAALAHTHYSESWHRPRLDADILIAQENRARVFDVLHRRGYAQPPFISGELVMYQTPFSRVDHLGIEHALDIHWRIVNPQMVSQALMHAELVERSQTILVQNHPIRVPSSVDSLVMACLHRVHHPDTEPPFWSDDIHRLAGRLDESEWQAFVARAAKASIRTICLQGLVRAHERFQTKVPADVLTALAGGGSEPSVRLLRRDLRPVDRLMAELGSLGPRGAMRLLREHLLPPAGYIQAKYGSSSRAWLPAYYAIRLWQGMAKWMKTA